ncbi:hypothetical protein CI610_01834 [invertebrate metagenome]|uniref:Uncharacterized protein n=1 Tax=invertebrate metagenome TaxID=1711999 RepID=A0A2H9T7N1_9ZZZZ
MKHIKSSWLLIGRFNQAVDLLHKAINKNPERLDLKKKLLEVYADDHDLKGFKALRADIDKVNMPELWEHAERLKVRFDPDAFSEEIVDDKNIPASAEKSSESVGSVNTGVDLDINLDAEADNTSEETEALNLDLTESTKPDKKSFIPDAEDDADNGLAFEPEPQLKEVTNKTEVPQSDDDDDGLAFDVSDLSLGRNDKDEADKGDEPGTDNGVMFPGEDSELGEEMVRESMSGLEEALDSEDMDFLSDEDEVATKIDLAQAYLDMGDTEGARDILGEVAEQGTEAQKQEAQDILDNMD